MFGSLTGGLVRPNRRDLSNSGCMSRYFYTPRFILDSSDDKYSLKMKNFHVDHDYEVCYPRMRRRNWRFHVLSSNY